LREEYLEVIFEKIGGTLRSFEFSGGCFLNLKIKDTIISALTNGCENLTKLTINYVDFKDEDYFALENCFMRLTFLDLSRCSINDSTLTFSLDGDKLRKIKTLKLAGNVSMSGKFYKDMKHVENLDVSYCYELNYFHFFEFLQKCENLVELNATASCQLIPEDRCIITDLLNNQPRLEVIVMDNVGLEKNNEKLRQFSKLKYSSFSGRKFGT
jgi:hypothetical protein